MLVLVAALDGAAPLFETYGLHPRKQDVLYLDAVHTSAGTNLLMGHVGLRRPFGHVDFYPNGGVHQKGCEQSQYKRGPEVWPNPYTFDWVGESSERLAKFNEVRLFNVVPDFHLFIYIEKTACSAETL